MRFLKEGDYAAFETLFTRYREKYRQFISAMVKDNDVADDIAQNIFMKLWINREKLDENLSLTAYLYVMSKYEIFNHFRMLRNRRTSAMSELGAGISKVIENPAASTPFEELTFSELSNKVANLIEQMPPKRREIFRMSRFEQLSTKDIASKMGISPRTVEEHIHLALKDLKKNVNNPVLLLFVFLYL
ncbi:MAG: RNA polymerase sigma-70 factor [Prevotellaceae bacterium]|nr:RNA polymerase sigma-70 factor [Prevotellaceae bacterium]